MRLAKEEQVKRKIGKLFNSEGVAITPYCKNASVDHDCSSMGVMNQDLKPKNFLFLSKGKESPLNDIVNDLSTEQWKSLTIAIGLLANHSIIFMDKPISGLGARAAAIDTGRTFDYKIYRPHIDIFEAFDEPFLEKRHG